MTDFYYTGVFAGKKCNSVLINSKNCNSEELAT